MSILHQSGAGHEHPRTKTDWAKTYAQAGARVLPLRPQSKTPALKDWPNTASCDLAQVADWFDNGPANLGIAMGAWANQDTYLVCIDLDRHEADKDGVQAWQRLVEQHGGDQGQPFIADTATGGLHLLYQSPVPLSNEKGALPPGVDVRGVGGQIMVQPSVHPVNGKTPQWRNPEAWLNSKPGPLPQWVLDIIQDRPQIAAAPPDYRRPLPQGGDPRPGDEYNRTHTWQQVLSNDGWQDLGNNAWLRPGKSVERNQSPSAVLYPEHGEHGVLVVFSTNAPANLCQPQFATNTGGHYKLTSPWAYEVAQRYGGDFVTAARDYGREQRQADERHLSQLAGVEHDTHDTPLGDKPEPGHTWVLRSLSELIGVPYEPVVPQLLHYDNQDTGLMYGNAHNLLAAPSGVGKSWLQGIVCVQEIRRGNHVAVIDYEMNMRDWFRRLRALGATDTELTLVHYCQPDEAMHQWLSGQQHGEVKGVWPRLSSELQRISELGALSFVAIDGVTNAMTANSLKLLDNQDIAEFWRLLPERIVRLTGAGVALNDHVPKNAKGDTVLPLGGQHKVASTSGSVFTARAVSYPSRVPVARDGVVVLRCIKDRHGQVGQQGSEVAQVLLTPKPGDRMDWQVLPYSDNPLNAANAERDKVLRAVVELSEQGVQGSLNAVANLSGVSNKTTCGQHLQVLVAEGRAYNAGTQQRQDWKPQQAPGLQYDADDMGGF